MDNGMNKGELSSHNHSEYRADFNIYVSLIASQIKSADYLIQSAPGQEGKGKFDGGSDASMLTKADPFTLN